MSEQADARELIEHLEAARTRTLALIEGLEGEQLMGPMLDIVNPLLWEIGHVAWFHEQWILRNLDAREPLIPNADALYDSSAIPHDERWRLALPPLERTLDYMERVHRALIERLEGRAPDAADAYFYRLTAFHEDMHDEAFVWTRQTLGYPTPGWPGLEGEPPRGAGPLDGDVEVPGGTFLLGATPDQGFVFDNEQWAHEVAVEPFRIARAPVTHAEFARFVDDGGYHRPELWEDEGRAWLAGVGREHPIYWRRGRDGWEVRRFDRWLPLPEHAPMMHVSWHEARAWCRWAGRRLPSEAEWEMAAACEPSPDGAGVGVRKRRYPWGDDPPVPGHAALDGRWLGCPDVAALAAGDSAFGCRQMLGSVWEWTADTFRPYPGFEPGPYRDYSEPWFGTRKVLRGGAWITPGRMLRNTWRNFFIPDRADVFAGFRTCAL